MSQSQSQLVIDGLLAKKWPDLEKANAAIAASNIGQNYGSLNGRAVLLSYVLNSRKPTDYNEFRDATMKAMDCKAVTFENNRRGLELLVKMNTGSDLNWSMFNITRTKVGRGRGPSILSETGKSAFAALAAKLKGAPQPIGSVIDPKKAPAGSGQPQTGKSGKSQKKS